MADYMPGEIWIGGTVRASDVDELCEKIKAAHLSLDWGDAAFSALSAEDLLNAREEYKEALVLHLCNDQASYGYFESLEEFLQARRILYDRRSDGKYEFNPLFVEYRPELGFFEQLTDHAGTPALETKPLYEVSRNMAAALSSLHQGAVQVAQEKLQAAYKLLHEHLPPIVPPLPSLQIAG